MSITSHELLFLYIQSKSGLELSDADKELVTAVFIPKHLRKRQYLLQEGDICKYLAFIVKGAGRVFAVNSSGQENIFRFAVENWWLGDYESYTCSTPSIYNIEMLEDSDVLMITLEHLEELKQTVKAIDVMVREIEKNGVVATQRRIHSAISLNAEERYTNLLKTYPIFLERFPQAMIASYLGITAETLSRIRKNLLKK